MASARLAAHTRRACPRDRPAARRTAHPQRHRITQAEVHALPTRRAMCVCGVAGEQYPPGPVLVRHRSGSGIGIPRSLCHPHRRSTRPAGVEQSLRVGDVRLFRCIVDFGHESERPVRKRRHDQHAGVEKNSRTWSAGRPPAPGRRPTRMTATAHRCRRGRVRARSRILLFMRSAATTYRALIMLRAVHSFHAVLASGPSR